MKYALHLTSDKRFTEQVCSRVDVLRHYFTVDVPDELAARAREAADTAAALAAPVPEPVLALQVVEASGAVTCSKDIAVVTAALSEPTLCPYAATLLVTLECALRFTSTVRFVRRTPAPGAAPLRQDVVRTVLAVCAVGIASLAHCVCVHCDGEPRRESVKDSARGTATVLCVPPVHEDFTLLASASNVTQLWHNRITGLFLVFYGEVTCESAGSAGETKGSGCDGSGGGVGSGVRAAAVASAPAVILRRSAPHHDPANQVAPFFGTFALHTYEELKATLTDRVAADAAGCVVVKCVDAVMPSLAAAGLDTTLVEKWRHLHESQAVCSSACCIKPPAPAPASAAAAAGSRDVKAPSSSSSVRGRGRGRGHK